MCTVCVAQPIVDLPFADAIGRVISAITSSAETTRTSQETSEVEDLRSPDKKDADRHMSVNKQTYRTDSPNVYQASMAISYRFESKS